MGQVVGESRARLAGSTTCASNRRRGEVRGTRYPVWRRPARWSAGLALVLCACGQDVDLPAVEIGRSLHFRYYARAADRVPPPIFDHLEGHWANMSTFFGLKPDSVIDYYLYDSIEDLEARGPCAGVAACAAGASVHTTMPFHEHELIHAYLSQLGFAPPIISEGVASGLSCFEYFSPPADTPVDLPWQDVARLTHRDRQGGAIEYGAMRLVRHIIREHGPATFARFYGYAAYTLDPALFALEFERFFGRSLDETWAEATAPHTTPTYLDEAMCPCATGALPLDGSAVAIPWRYGATVPPLPFRLETDTSVRLALSGIALTNIRNCWDDVRVHEILQADAVYPPSQIVIPLRAGHYYVQSLLQGGAPGSIAIEQGDWLATECGDGEPLRVDAGTRGQLVIRARPGAALTYARLTVDGPRPVTTQFAVSGISVCPSCAAPPADCVAPSAAPAGATLDGSYIVRLEPGRSAVLTFE
jgi:hypothetical protein